MEARNLVVGKRGIGHLSAIEMDLLEQRKAKLHDRAAGNLRLDDLRIDGRAASTTLDQLCDLHVAGFGVDFNLGAGAAE